MKRFTRLTAVFLLAVSLLLLASCTPLDESTAVVVEDPVEWEVSDDGSTLYGDGVTYARFSYGGGLTVDPLTEYEYYNEVYLPFDGYGAVSLYSYARGGDVVWAIGDDGYAEIYANESGTAALLDFLETEPTVLYLMDDSSTRYRSALDVAELTAFETLRQNGTASETVKVSSLSDAPCYKIVAYDDSEILRYDYGAIYEYEGAYYYLNYLVLDNSYFDADGNFSYRSGDVVLTKLSGALSESTDGLIEGMEYFYYSYSYETVEGEASVYDDTTAIVLFWTTYAMIGFVTPIPFLVLGIAFPHSEKRGYPKYWYAVAIAATVWILAAGALMLVLVL